MGPLLLALPLPEEAVQVLLQGLTGVVIPSVVMPNDLSI